VRTVKPNLSEGGERLFARIAMVVLLLVCVGFASLRLDFIAELSSMASGGLLVMAPAIIGAFFWKRATAAGALVSMGAGGVLTAVMYLTGTRILGWWPSVWGAAVTTLLFVVVSLVTRAPVSGAAFVDEVESGLRTVRE
jgi:SSS family solute:Na+ symporter